MLLKLHIQNYAIIDDLSIEFSDNLNIITGETGAGKSIVMGALGLILGNRADISMLQHQDKKCVVEGNFKIRNKKNISHFLTENDLDQGDELVIRREITTNGKSRAFINDTPVNLIQLKTLNNLLVDLHQQFDTLELGELSFQREVLDAFADNTSLLTEYASIYNLYIHSKKELAQLLETQTASNAGLEYNTFLFNELEDAGLNENELEDAETELKFLSNAETIKQDLSAIYFELIEGDQPLIQQLKLLQNKLQNIEKYHSNLEFINNRIQSTQIELTDIANEIASINNQVEYNAERINALNDRISIGYRLLKKHQVKTTAELLDIKEQLKQQLKNVININDKIVEKEKYTALLLVQCNELANKISINRNKTIAPFANSINELLSKVGMPNALIKIKLSKTELSAFGFDDIQFLFDANKSNRFEHLHKVASGGELSRLMLCIKSLVAKKLQLPTLIFDEIDTGISGEAAKQVGNIMKELSTQHQLIAITHQPQIAAKANAHYFVFKANKGNKIVTSIKLLNNEERITTIAQMLSGKEPTTAAIENAKEMIAD